jgi:uncharacterized membrane protein YhaH (DUF805 family)
MPRRRSTSSIEVAPNQIRDEDDYYGRLVDWCKALWKFWYFEPWRKFAEFDGRASRKEFWVFLLGNTIFSSLAPFVLDNLKERPDSSLPENVSALFVSLFMFAVLIPSLAVLVRRLHDTDHRGWWFFVPVVPWVFACMKGTPGDNRFGTDPKRV